MNARAVLLLLATMLVAQSPPIFAQSTNRWRVFTRADGLAENGCLSVTLGAGGNILVRHLKSTEVSVLDGYDVNTVPGPGASRHRVYESPGGQLWSASPEGLREFRDGQWVSYRISEIAQFFQSGITHEIGLLPVRQGRVLILLPDLLLQFAAEDPEQPRLDVLRRVQQSTLGRFEKMVSTSDGILWLVGTRGSEHSSEPVRNLKPDQPWVAANALPPELHPPKIAAPSPDEISVRKIYDVAVQPDGVIWVATSDGLYRRAPQLWEPVQRTVEIPSPPKTPGLPKLPGEIAARATWHAIHTARNGDLWLASFHEIAWRHQESWRFFTSTNQIGPEEVIAFAETPDGRIWCATPNQVWRFDGRNWVVLLSLVSRINGFHGARDGTLWVAADNGIHRFAQGEWIANGPEEGLPLKAILAVAENSSGQILALASNDTAMFHPEADTQPPRTQLLANTTKETNFREGSTVTLSYRGRDKWKSTAASRLLFSYRLDERDWSPFLDLREVSFGDLPLGRHYFQVRAMDRNGNFDLTPALLEFSIIVPWYRETRLVLILSVALGVALFFAALAANRHRKLRLSYAEVERKIAERTRELEIANQELLHSQKMTALGTLSAGIAHDFNNILSIIKGSSQIIEDNLDRPDKIRTRLDRIKTVVQQGAGIVEAMLGFSRGSDQQTTPHDINDIVDDTLKLLGDRFLRETDVSFQRNPALPRIAVARDFVQQVLLNFLFNAAESTTGRKHVTLTTRLLEAAPAGIILSPARGGPCIAISVRDSGGGIAPENLPRIFEPFFTTKALSARRGTGLGLSMVYELAKKLEAGLAVETVVGQGSTFTIFLPAKTESPRLVQSEIEMRS